MNRKEVINYLVESKNNKTKTEYSGFTLFRTKDMKFKRREIDSTLSHKDSFYQTDHWTKDINKIILINSPMPDKYTSYKPGDCFIVQFHDFKLVDVMDMSLLSEYKAQEFFNYCVNIKSTLDYLKKIYNLNDEEAEKFFNNELNNLNPTIIDEVYFWRLAKKSFQDNGMSYEITGLFKDVVSIEKEIIRESAYKSLKGIILRNIGDKIQHTQMPYKPRLLYDNQHFLKTYLNEKLFFELVFIDDILKIRVLDKFYPYQDEENLKKFIDKFYEDANKIKLAEDEKIAKEKEVIKTNEKKLRSICNETNLLLQPLDNHIYHIVHITRWYSNNGSRIKYVFSVTLTDFINKKEIFFSGLLKIVNSIVDQLNSAEYSEQFTASIPFKKEWIL